MEENSFSRWLVSFLRFADYKAETEGVKIVTLLKQQGMGGSLFLIQGNQGKTFLLSALVSINANVF